MTATVLLKITVTLAVATGFMNGIAQNREFLTLVNTFLNGASWWLLIKAQRKLRNDVTPKLTHVEEQVAAVAEQVSNNNTTPDSLPGGRRVYDPPTDNR
jgi:hypothetical protein